MKTIKSFKMASVCAFLLIAPAAPTFANSNTPTAEEYRDFYIYAYPLVLMEVTKNVMTNVPDKNGYSVSPINQFQMIRSFPDASFRDVVRPNADTLYETAWCDVSHQALVLHLPDTKGKYYLMPMLDAWTNVFASPGSRTSGTRAHDYYIVGPKTKVIHSFPGMTVVHSPTSLFWIIGRIQTNGKKDYKTVNDLQDQIKLVPANKWKKVGANYTPPKVKVNVGINLKVAPPEQILKMSSDQYINIFTHSLRNNPPVKNQDAAMIKLMEKIGIQAGLTFQADKKRQVIERGFKIAKKAIVDKSNSLGKKINGWSIVLDHIGKYGNNYLQRAAVSLFGLGANLTDDAVYPVTSTDKNGAPLSGTNRYTIHFTKDQLPPVNAFWSITLYDKDGYFVDNPIKRFAIGDRDNLHYDKDGGLTLYIQKDEPVFAEMKKNWLPAPDGDFNLTLRLYWPKAAVISGQWVPPSVLTADAK